MILISTAHDIDGTFIPLLEQIRPKLSPFCKNSVVACTPATHQDTIKVLKSIGFTVIEGGSFNQGRILGLKKAMEIDPNETSFFSCCLDKLIHWLEFEENEFHETFNSLSPYGIQLLGRSEKAWSTYPQSWVQTEQIVNRLLSKKMGIDIDALTGDLIVSRNAAELICAKSVEVHAGACVEWPLMVLQHDMTVGCILVNGLSWEDADRSQSVIEAEGGLELWKEKFYEGIAEWKKRSQFQVDMIVALERFE
jgi:hypothetical protein